MMPIALDKDSPVPLYRQVQEAILLGISNATLRPGQQLPTIRDLAGRLEVNPNTIAKAYAQLQWAGVLDTRQGTGVFVSDPPAAGLTPDGRRRIVDELCRDFVSRGQMLGVQIHEIVAGLKRLQAQANGAD